MNQKIKIIYDLKMLFSLSESYLGKCINHMENSEKKNPINKFIDDYTVEEYFHILFTAFPWVKLIHKLDQKQMPLSSKSNYQAPTFMLFYETSKKELKPLVIEVKSVKEDKTELEINKQQHDTKKNYSDTLQIPFLYSVYWKKFDVWTLNTIEHLKDKLEGLFIDFETAMVNDLSIIMGNYYFYILEPFYRRTTYTLSDNFYALRSPYGKIAKDEISNNNQDYTELNVGEAVIVDLFSLEVIKEIKDTSGNIAQTIERLKFPSMERLSTLITGWLGLTGKKLTDKFLDLPEDTSKTPFYFACETMRKINIGPGYTIPRNKTPMTDKLFKDAFENSWVWRAYYNSDNHPTSSSSNNGQMESWPCKDQTTCKNCCG